jgi:hypothetical protein
MYCELFSGEVGEKEIAGEENFAKQKRVENKIGSRLFGMEVMTEVTSL